MINKLSQRIGMRVKRLFLIVWPPYGEDDFSEVDVCAGYVFHERPQEMLVISTDKNDLVKPLILLESIPTDCFSWNDFQPRMSTWMNMPDDMDLDTEFYDVSDSELFTGIVGQRIQSIELIEVDEPIGIKIIFDQDYVLSLPNIDGNTIQTKQFNKNDIVKNFSSLGTVTYTLLNTI